MSGNANLYIDESGDLGWNFDAPYRTGGSSRYLTIAGALVVAGHQKHLTRLIRDMYTARRWHTANEKKWTDMVASAKMDFAARAATLSEGRSGISFHSITVYKPNVAEHIRSDGNKLYNYMIGLLFLRHLQKYDAVTFVPDERAVKVSSGNSLHDYLQTKLWFDKGAATILRTQPGDSAKYRSLQFADMLAGCVQERFEDSSNPAYDRIRPELAVKRLFFP